MKNTILCIMLLLATIYIEIMYDYPMTLTFLAFEILLFIGMTLLVWYMKHSIFAHLEVKFSTVQKQNQVETEVWVENRGILPVTRIFLWLSVENEYTHREELMPLMCQVHAGEKTRLSYEIVANYCGRIKVCVPQIKIYDYLGLVSMKIKCTDQAYVTIMPNIVEIQTEISEQTRNIPVDGEEYDNCRSGDDPSEIFQIREFRSGDTLQRVHWKLSAKADQLMTKEYGRPVGCHVLVVLDLYHGGKGEYSIEKRDAFIEIAVAISYGIWKAGISHDVVWFDERKGGICKQGIQEESQVYEMVMKLLKTTHYKTQYDLKTRYLAKHSQKYPGAILYLDTNLVIYKNNEELASFSPDHLFASLCSLTLRF